VAAITSVGSDEKAIELANRSAYGLSAGVFSSDVGRAIAVGNRLNTGLLHINDQTLADEPYMPFGGTGASGNGTRIGGPANWEEFTQWQWMTIKENRLCLNGSRVHHSKGCSTSESGHSRLRWSRPRLVHVRFNSDSDRQPSNRDPALRAMYGRCPRCKRNLTFLRSVRVQPCIRPVVAWRITSVAMQPQWLLALM